MFRSAQANTYTQRTAVLMANGRCNPRARSTHPVTKKGGAYRPRSLWIEAGLNLKQHHRHGKQHSQCELNPFVQRIHSALAD